MEYKQFSDGIILRADATAGSTIRLVRALLIGQTLGLIDADPPYGEIVGETWDNQENVTSLKTGSEEAERAFEDWMMGWTIDWSELLPDGGAMYCWGAVGVPGFRPFYGYRQRIERVSKGLLSLANDICWSKVRAYGTDWNYLFTREELAYLCKGNPRKPRVFNVPLTDIKRGYEGYDKAHPAKSEFKRRTNVWHETEILRGKRNPCQKAPAVCRIPIETHTNPGETVLNLFAGSASVSQEARKLKRRWLAVESGAEEYGVALEWLNETKAEAVEYGAPSVKIAECAVCDEPGLVGRCNSCGGQVG